VKLKPAQEHWYRVAICLHEFGQLLVAPRLQILEIFRVIGAEPHHHVKVADRSGDEHHQQPTVYYAAVLMGRITGLARPSVTRPSS